MESLTNRAPNFDDDDENFDVLSWLTGWIPFAITLIGSVSIFRFLAYEVNVTTKKMRAARENFTLFEILQYRMDHYFSNHDSAKSILLMSITFILIVTTTATLYLVTGEDIGVCMWNAWTYVADAGTHAEAEGSARKFVALGTTIAGMLVFAMFIGLVSDSIQEGLDNLRKGRCRVVESGHTVMLGWGSKSLSIIQQIALANRSEGGGLVAVLCEHDKVEMERLLEAAAADDGDGGFRAHGTAVIFRSGDPLGEGALAQVAAASARSIIAVAREGIDPDEADALAVQQLLALRLALGPGSVGHVVAEVVRVPLNVFFNFLKLNMLLIM
jgi:ion channel POLLUX/CASTOR